MKFAIALIASVFVVAVHCDVPTKAVVDKAFADNHKRDGKDDLSKDELKAALISLKIAEAKVTANLNYWFKLVDADDDNDVDKDEFLILVWFITAKGDDEFISQAELQQIIAIDLNGGDGVFPDDDSAAKLFGEANIIKGTGTNEKLSFAEFQVFIYYHLAESDRDNDKTLDKPELKVLLTFIGNTHLAAKSDDLFDDAQKDNTKSSLTYDEAAPLILFAIYEDTKDTDTEMSPADFGNVIKDLISGPLFSELDKGAPRGSLSFKEFKPVLDLLAH